MDDQYIPLSVPNLSGNERAYVTRALESGWVSTAGPYVDRFEQNVAAYVGAKGAVSCQNGTAGLHLGLQCCGVKADDAVIVPALTFIAAVNPVSYLGALPIFMDCDDSLCMDPVMLERFCREECYVTNGVLYHRATGRAVRAMVVVHIFGNMADMESILPIARRYHLKVVEDSTEALGSYYVEGLLKGRFAGTMGDVGVYSFNGNKIITTGGGGMLVSHDGGLLEQARHLATQAKSDELYYTHDAIGYNYRMTNLQAAMGLAQLERLEEFIAVKQRNYQVYANAFAGVDGLQLLNTRSTIRSNRWFYALLCRQPCDRDKLLFRLQAHHIQTRPVWGLICQQPPYRDAPVYEINRAVYYQQRVLNLPCSSNLTEQDAALVARTILQSREE